MSKAQAEVTGCPVDATFQLIGKKWTVLLIRDMMRGIKRFNQFLASVPELNPKTLAVRLKEMERSGLVERRVIAGTPVHTEYTLTEKGRALQPVLNAMVAYASRWCSESIFSDGRPRSFEEFLQMAKGSHYAQWREWIKAALPAEPMAAEVPKRKPKRN